MDPFTQRMLERAKSRREKLDSQKMVLGNRSPLQEKSNFKETVSDQKSVAEIKTGKQYITPLRKSKLQKLAQFYSSDNENVFLEDEEFDEEEKDPCDSVQNNKCKLGRLNELASKIKQWEDDSNHKKKDNREENTKQTKTKAKENIWDSSMVEKLCSQGFSRSESQAKLVYDFKTNNKEQKNDTNAAKGGNHDKAPKPTTTTKAENPVGGRYEVLRKAAFFEGSEREPSNKPAKDPAELPLMERKALFERNKGKAVLPKNPFFPERKVPPKIFKLEKKENQVNEIRESNSQQNEIERNKNIFDRNVITERPIQTEIVLSEEKDRTVKPSDLIKGKQMVPNPPPMPAFNQNSKETPKNTGGEKGIYSPSPQSGRLYPSLSSLDITEESGINHSRQDSFNESKNSNLCLNMSLSDLLEMNKNNPTTPPSDQSFSQSKECQVLNKMDKLLEDALNDISSEYDGDSDDMVPSPPKMQKSSSFEYKSGQEKANPVLHTVSFYRKQQQNLCTTEDKAEDSEEMEEMKPDVDEGILVQNKIQVLTAEVNKQQTIISQASQALNLCLSTVEFSGSGEQVEGERLLLLASHKRQACLNEIQRLKVENCLWTGSGRDFLTDRGDVNLTNISIRLKRDALRSIAAAENLQYFVCLVKSDEQVLATPAVPAIKENLKDMALQFPGQVKLEGLLSNFKIIVEVYNLELGKELLPHDIKYHLVAKKEKKLLTPIKSKKSESKLVKPNIQSPAGPNAVRTSNFQLCGYIVLSLKEITRTQWILNKVPYVSPVEGTISMSIQSQLRLNDEFRGFLTMFDDISGFGAWHRRWCLLSSHFISYWKYPDDETKKVPIGTIDLKSVITENVGSVSRDICARLNTFLVETTRPKLSGDQNSLVMSVKDDVTTIRHLLSADSKQEMTMWCKKLNTALALLRSWKCNSNE